MNEVKAYFNSLAERWDSICSHDKNKLSAIVTLAGIKETDRVLDIACGTGILFDELLKRNPAEITGIDISDKMIEKAAEKFADKSIRLIAKDLFDFEETGFDVAIIYSAYPHFNDKQRLCKRLDKLLKPKGRMIIAHSQSKEEINARHIGSDVKEVSSHLMAASKEKTHFMGSFNIDIEVDTDEIYILSGVKG